MKEFTRTAKLTLLKNQKHSLDERGFILVLHQNRKGKAFLIFIGFEERKPPKFTSFIRQGTSTQRSNRAPILCFGRNALLKQGILGVFNRFLHHNQERLFPLMDHQNTGIIALKKQNEQEKHGSIPTTNSRSSQHSSFWGHINETICARKSFCQWMREKCQAEEGFAQCCARKRF